MLFAQPGQAYKKGGRGGAEARGVDCDGARGVSGVDPDRFDLKAQDDAGGQVEDCQFGCFEVRERAEQVQVARFGQKPKSFRFAQEAQVATPRWQRRYECDGCLGRSDPETLGQAFRWNQEFAEAASVGWVHAEACGVDRATLVMRCFSQGFEVTLPDDQHRRSQTTFGDQA